jgi:hypothetical protein
LKWNKSEQTHTDRSALNGAERFHFSLREKGFLYHYMHTRSGTEWGMEWNGMKQNETEWQRYLGNGPYLAPSPPSFTIEPIASSVTRETFNSLIRVEQNEMD